MLRSKTMGFAVLIAVLGILEQNGAVLTKFVGAENIGVVMMVISAVVAILRVFTSQPLSEK